MQQAFQQVKVQPIYGKYRALITWKVNPELAAGSFVVFKSADGVNDWQEVAKGQGLEEAVDDNLISQGKLIEHYYKVRVTKDGKTFDSVPVGTFGEIRRDLFGAARVLMNTEYDVLRRFTRFLLCKLKVNAPPCPVCVDDETGQAVGTSLCESCYTTRKLGGFYPPIATFGRVLSTTPQAQMDSQDSTGTSDPTRSKIRMIAFPRLRKDDLLVNPSADRRYLVEDVEYSDLGGAVPVIATVSTVLLVAKDIRYKFPL